jgi:hypothetical protein
LKRISLYIILLTTIVLLLAACKSPAPESTTVADPYAVFTAVALTAEANGQQISSTTSATIPPTNTPISSAPGDGTSSTPPTGKETAVSGTPSGSGDAAAFVKDISIPDGKELPPNGSFVKTWLLRNTGTTTWTTAYNLVFIGGDRMDAPESVPLPRDVPPDETVELSVELVAPNSPATYTAYFNLQNTNGDNFGVGVGAIEAFWVEITVSESAAPLATATPDASAEYVTQVFMYVDSTSANECPHTFDLTAKITLSNPATVTYQLEADTSNPAFQIDLPDPVTAKLAAGTHTFEYKLTFTSAYNGWVILHVTSPGDHYSNTVNLTLNCQ